MMPQNNLTIRVPASTANLGPGFDSVGLALNLYLTLEVELSNAWDFRTTSDELADLPTDSKHFICQVALGVAKKYGCVLPPCKVLIHSEIPLARGLGSSAAAIIAGIELADSVGKLSLTKEEKLIYATELEGHPDNVGASLYGGLVVGCYQQGEVNLLAFPNLNIEAVVVIPDEILLTKDARGVLPETFPYHKAVQASATANLLLAALLSENWELAGKMMERDLFHQPFRKPLIPLYEEIERAAKENGAFGVALSGAGPTLICFAEQGKGEKLAKVLQSHFMNMKVNELAIDKFGSHVVNTEKCIAE